MNASGTTVKWRISAVSSTGKRTMALSMKIANWSQSSSSSVNAKFSGMPFMPQGLASGSKPPIKMAPTSSRK